MVRVNVGVGKAASPAAGNAIVIVMIVVLMVMTVGIVEVGVTVVRGGTVNFVHGGENKCGCWQGVTLTLSSCVS
jgi:hypothetical protein